MIIDAHFHCPGADSPTAEKLMEVLDMYEISHAVVSGLEVFKKAKSASFWNDALAGLRYGAPERISALGNGVPQRPGGRRKRRWQLCSGTEMCTGCSAEGMLSACEKYATRFLRGAKCSVQIIPAPERRNIFRTGSGW